MDTLATSLHVGVDTARVGSIRRTRPAKHAQSWEVGPKSAFVGLVHDRVYTRLAEGAVQVLAPVGVGTNLAVCVDAGSSAQFRAGDDGLLANGELGLREKSAAAGEKV